jgi:WD40 repeat protein
MAINPDGTTLAIATDQGQVALYEIAGNGVQTLITSGAQQMIAFSPDGKKLILTNEDGVVQFRNLDSGGGRIILQNKTDVYSMAVSPKGLVALGAQDKVIVFEAETGELVADLKSMGKNQLLKFNPQGDLLSTSTLTEIHIWQFGDKGFEQIANPLGNQAFSMSFNPAGDRLMVGEQDQIRILDPLTGDELYRIRQKGAVTGVTFSTDGNTLFAASLRSLQSFDLTLVKNISGDDIMDSACSRLTQNLNDSEWALFFGDEVYEKLCPSLP